MKQGRQTAATAAQTVFLLVEIPPQTNPDDPLAVYKSAVRNRDRKRQTRSEWQQQIAEKRRQQIADKRQRRRQVIRTVVIAGLIAILALETGILAGLFLRL